MQELAAKQSPERVGRRGKSLGQLLPGAARILVYESVLDQILAHSDAQQQHEIGGFLIGGAFADEAYKNHHCYVEIRGFLPAENTVNQAAHLVFTHETWSRMRQEITTRFPNDSVVGWYHTHPGLGIFFSEYDRFIHRHFFGSPWHVALVVDPRRGEFAFFEWHNGDIVDTGFVCLWGDP